MNCMTKGCTRTAASQDWGRGLCLVCYSRAKRLIEMGTTTWSELVKLGLALPSEEFGTDPFTSAFNEAKSKSEETANASDQ